QKTRSSWKRVSFTAGLGGNAPTSSHRGSARSLPLSSPAPIKPNENKPIKSQAHSGGRPHLARFWFCGIRVRNDASRLGCKENPKARRGKNTRKDSATHSSL